MPYYTTNWQPTLPSRAVGTFGIVTYAQVDPDSRGAVKGDAAVVRGPWSVSRRAARAGDSNLPSLSGTDSSRGLPFR